MAAAQLTGWQGFSAAPGVSPGAARGFGQQLSFGHQIGFNPSPVVQPHPGVSPGAVAHWEAGQRDISGPVEKLLEIFEQQLEDKYESGRSKKRRH